MKFHNWLPVLSRTSYRQGVVTAWDFRNSDNALEGTWKGCIVTYVFTLATTTISPVSIQSVGGAGGQLACLPLRSGTVSAPSSLAGHSQEGHGRPGMNCLRNRTPSDYDIVRYQVAIPQDTSFPPFNFTPLPLPPSHLYHLVC